MKALVHYEMKKIWKRKSTGVVFLLMLLSIIAISLIFVSDQGYCGRKRKSNGIGLSNNNPF